MRLLCNLRQPATLCKDMQSKYFLDRNPARLRGKKCLTINQKETPRVKTVPEWDTARGPLSP